MIRGGCTSAQFPIVIGRILEKVDLVIRPSCIDCRAVVFDFVSDLAKNLDSV